MFDVSRFDREEKRLYPLRRTTHMHRMFRVNRGPILRIKINREKKNKTYPLESQSNRLYHDFEDRLCIRLHEIEANFYGTKFVRVSVEVAGQVVLDSH